MATFDNLLVSCVYEKAAAPAAAKNLYTEPYFERLRRYAERQAKPWYIISAEHGLVQPEEWLAPYERQAVWGSWVVARLGLLAGDLADRVVEIHAAPGYIARIAPGLAEAGATVQVPLADVPWNEHLAWYDEQARNSPTD
jgi:hypothetical protein